MNQHATTINNTVYTVYNGFAYPTGKDHRWKVVLLVFGAILFPRLPDAPRRTSSAAAPCWRTSSSRRATRPGRPAYCSRNRRGPIMSEAVMQDYLQSLRPGDLDYLPVVDAATGRELTVEELDAEHPRNAELVSRMEAGRR
jgi:hypothetical protein